MTPSHGAVGSIHFSVNSTAWGIAGGARRTLWAGLSIVVLFLLACARAPSFDVDGEPVGGAREIVQRINRNALLINSLSADVRLRSAHIPQSKLARADLLYARPEHYRVQLKTIFGNTMAVFTVRQGQAELYLPLSNQLYQGELTAERIRDLVGIELPAVDLLETLSGIFYLPDDTELLDYRRIGEDHLLVFSWDQGRREIRMAPDGYRILWDRYLDARGQAVMEKEFKEYRMIAGVLLPGQVTAFLPGEEEILEVWFSHQTVDVSWKEEDFHLHLPDGVERIPWDREYR